MSETWLQEQDKQYKMAPLNLPVGQTSITVRVQPVVLFSICDAYIRRNEGKDRVIGTLLGSISDGVVDIRECYAVPHNESMDQVLHSLTQLL